MLYVLYQKSESLEKLRYPVLFDLIDGGKLPGLNATSSEGGRKRPESSSPEKLKARNKEKFSGDNQDHEIAKNKAKEAAAAVADDNYEEEFEQLLDKDDDDEEVNAANEGKVSDSRGKKQSNRNSDSKKKDG